MSNIQTGSNQAVQPLPRRDPWASFAIHGMPPEVPHPHAEVSPGVPPWADLSAQHGWRGLHRAPRRRVNWRGMLTVLGITVLAVGSCGAPAPAAVSQAPAPIVFEWSAPGVTPASQRRIEVVDKIKPTAWDVRGAVNWLDRYTASDMVLVSRCSGRAYRCITVRGGKLPGKTVGWSEGSTITIDTAKLARSPYRSATYRQRLLVHELAHTFGLHHTKARGLMATTVDRMRLSLTAGQRAYLRAR